MSVKEFAVAHLLAAILKVLIRILVLLQTFNLHKAVRPQYEELSMQGIDLDLLGCGVDPDALWCRGKPMPAPEPVAPVIPTAPQPVVPAAAAPKKGRGK